MKAILTFFILTFFFLIPEVLAGVGIGMGPSNLDLKSNAGSPYYFNIIVYNPGSYDIKAKVTFECENCEENAYFFGWYIGRVREYYRQYFHFEPEVVYVPNNTIPENPVKVTVKVHPSLWVKKELIISTPEEINFLVRAVNPSYTGEFAIPYYTLLLNEKDIKGGITITAIWSTFGEMGAAPAVGAGLKLNIKGMPLGSFIIIVVIIIIVIALVLWKTEIYKRILPKKS